MPLNRQKHISVGKQCFTEHASYKVNDKYCNTQTNANRFLAFPRHASG